MPRQKVIVLYEVHLGRRAPNGQRWETILKTNKRHPWSGRIMYALVRRGAGRNPVCLFVPSDAQLVKIRKRSGVINITSKQTPSGIGMGSAH